MVAEQILEILDGFALDQVTLLKFRSSPCPGGHGVTATKIVQEMHGVWLGTVGVDSCSHCSKRRISASPQCRNRHQTHDDYSGANYDAQTQGTKNNQEYMG